MVQQEAHITSLRVKTTIVQSFPDMTQDKYSLEVIDRWWWRVEPRIRLFRAPQEQHQVTTSIGMSSERDKDPGGHGCSNWCKTRGGGLQRERRPGCSLTARRVLGVEVEVVVESAGVELR